MNAKDQKTHYEELTSLYYYTTCPDLTSILGRQSFETLSWENYNCAIEQLIAEYQGLTTFNMVKE